MMYLAQMIHLTREILQTTFEAGSIVKIHGINGRLVLRLDHPVDDLIDFPEWTFLVLGDQPVPFETAPDSVYLKDSRNLVIGLEGISNEEKARSLVGSVVRIPGEPADWFETFDGAETELSGFDVIDTQSGLKGEITGYRDIPGNPLLVVSLGGKEVFVPDNPAFVLSVNKPERTVTVQIPPELFDL